MSNYDLINRALSAALKQRMETTPINRIRVCDLTDDCGLTRHTFYNHFQDIYALLEWTYDQEVVRGLEECCSVTRWREGLELLLQYTEENRAICLNTFRSVGRDLLETFLFQKFSMLVTAVMRDIRLSVSLSEEDASLCIAFFTDALVGVFVGWLKRGLRDSAHEVAIKLERVLDGALFDMARRLEQKRPGR